MVKGLLTDGTLKDYFSKTQKFKSYGMIGYTLQTLDGIPAKMSETTSYDAVVWGEDLVTLQVSELFLGGGSVKQFKFTMDGEYLESTPEKPASKSRDFAGDGSGDPFKITKIRVVFADALVDWKLSPKDLGWFTNGQNTAAGRYPTSGSPYVNYTATKG
ncbi:hypothetical protein ACTVZO_07635 [Streptomyces sp. IBSNAI002]|uniref:hypothetical protein n=1 Tax=Streptomyces sp. IBSNAI002 TaxID=3457500 RepID=UPI003FD351D4